MRAPIRKSLRKWAVGVGCTLSVALMLQNARNSDAFQGMHPVTDGTSSSVQQDNSTPASQDPVFQEWQNQSDPNSPSDNNSGGSSSTFGGQLGGHGGSGFSSRSGHS
jgi:hypothetical protein